MIHTKFWISLMIAVSSIAQTFEVFVSDAGNFSNPPWQILKFDENGQNPEIFIDSFLDWPQDILFIEDSNQVLISNLGSGRINVHDASTGAFVRNFARSIGGPTRMKLGPDSLLYVLQWSGDGLVRRYDLGGNLVDNFTSVTVGQAIGLDWDIEGNLYVSSYSSDDVRKFGPAGEDLGLFIDANLSGPTNIWFDGNGDLLVSDYDGAGIKRFSPSGAYLGVFIAGLGQSEGIAYTPEGDLLVGNGATRSVKRFSSDGIYVEDLVETGSGGLLTPNAVVLRHISLTGIASKNATLPDELIVENTPNPFNASTIIRYRIAAYAEVKISIHDLRGQLVFEHDQGIQEPGWYELEWRGQWPSGAYLPSGVYVLTLQAGQRSFSNKMLYLK